MLLENIIKMFDKDYKIELIETPCYAGKVVETHIIELNDAIKTIKTIQENHPQGIYLMNTFPKVPLTGVDMWYMLNNPTVYSRYAYLRFAPK